MTDNTSKDTAKPDVHYALVVKDPSFPRGCYPVGTVEQVAAMYEELLERHLADAGEMDVITSKAMINAYKKGVQLYRLEREPSIQTGKVDPVTAVFKGLNLTGAVRKAREAVEGFDSKKLTSFAIKRGPKLAEIAYTAWRIRKGDPIAILTGGKLIYDAKDGARDAAKNFFERARDAGDDIMARMNGLDESVDGIVYNNIPFVKEEWITAPGNTARLADLSVFNTANSAGQAKKPGKGGPGGMA